ncbi:transposase [Bacteroides heparinolyticus]|uniref:Transposase n=1 Tax=Prevotella heparinolytica TaxID=28113 RepID=A0A449I6L4_9BACE|nr:transposase [Bacteroides heparinolyticus]VFB15073.1 transposase [Bacteroides heparinolyticus]
MTYVGIDVSKATFVVAYSSAKNSKTKTFKNTTKGIHEFIQSLSASEHHCVLEATGNYSSLLVYLLSQAGITVSLENPLKIKNFARVMLSYRHTDSTIVAPKPQETVLICIMARTELEDKPFSTEKWRNLKSAAATVDIRTTATSIMTRIRFFIALFIIFFFRTF